MSTSLMSNPIDIMPARARVLAPLRHCVFCDPFLSLSCLGDLYRYFYLQDSAD